MPEWGFVFDLDDTLYLERDYVRSGFQAAAAWALETQGIGGLFDSAWHLFESGARGSIFDRALESLRVTQSPVLIENLVRVYRTHSPCIAPAVETGPALAKLRRAGPMALITDGPPQSQRAKVAALNLAGVFEISIFTDEFGIEFRKPHPRAYAAVQRSLAGRVRRFVYIGDNPAKDFASPRSMGWKTVRIRRSGGLHSKSETNSAADCEIRSLEELPGALGGLPS